MKSSSVLIGWFLLSLSLAAGAAHHAGVRAAASATACRACSAGPRSIGDKGSTLNFSSLNSGERTAVNCATDKNCQLLRLRNIGLALKEKDGGNLTEQHRAELQAQLEAINTRFK